MGGLMSRNKGKRAEREIVDLLQPVVIDIYEQFNLEPPQLKRNTLQSDGGGSDIAGLPWLAIEVKHCESMTIKQWWKQACDQALPGQEPVLFYRRNKMAWKVRMYGMLGRPGCCYTVPVIVDVEHFMAWFRVRLTEELSK